MVEGKALLDQGKYPQAKSAFLRGGEDRADVAALAFAATAAYKAEDITEAARLLDAADSVREQGGVLLRIAGYKSLVLFAQGKQTAGLDSLKRYINLYNNLGTTMLNTVADTRDVERMLKTRRINVAILETVMDRQINSYEDEYREVSRGMMQGR
jgi:tetratricopeptide (TPR) repeat protein